MLAKEAFHLGTIVKTKGLKGEMVVHLHVDFAAELQFDHLFIDRNGKLIPYFIDKFSVPKPGTAYLQLQDIGTIEAAKKLEKQALYLPAALMPEKPDEFTFADLEGFIVTDETAGELGEIIQIEAYPQQWIATLHYKNRNVMLPLNEDFITAIDAEAGTVHMALPQGLLDIYLTGDHV